MNHVVGWGIQFPMRMLLIEDERKVADVVSRGLRAERYAVDVAHDGTTGWDMAAVCDYDVIILDLMLPGLSGEDLLQRLRRRQNKPAVLVLTARDTTADKVGVIGLFGLSLGLYPLIGKAYFPRTDPGQFVINLKAPTGTRLELTDRLVAQVENIVREVVPPDDLRIVVSNIGVTPGFSSIYTSNSGPHTAFVQVGLQPEHRLSSFAYMERMRARLARDLPQLSVYFQTGGLVDAVLNLGLPAPLDIQVSGSNLADTHRTAAEIAREVLALRGVSDVLVPQDIDAPALQLNIDRVRASQLGLNEKEVVDNLITALASDQMIAPSYWVDPRSGNDYLMTVQYPEDSVKNLGDLAAIPLRGPKETNTARLDAVSDILHIESPSEVDHYQLKRVIDVYVSPSGEDLSAVAAGVQRILGKTKLPDNVRVTVRGSVQAMQTSFRSFGLGLILSTLLVYLILVAQFESFLDPLLILLAVPTGLTGVLLILWLTHTTLNVMSLMGVVMMVGIVVSRRNWRRLPPTLHTPPPISATACGAICSTTQPAVFAETGRCVAIRIGLILRITSQ